MIIIVVAVSRKSRQLDGWTIDADPARAGVDVVKVRRAPRFKEVSVPDVKGVRTLFPEPLPPVILTKGGHGRAALRNSSEPMLRVVSERLSYSRNHVASQV